MQRKRTLSDMQVIVDSIISYNGQTDRLHMETTGKLYEKNGTWYLFYKEPEDSSLAGVTTTIKATGNCVSILRSEPYASRIIVEPGKTFFTTYQTAGGIFDLEVRGQRVAVLMRENGGEIRLQYGLLEQTVSMTIQVKESV